ncbi:MAG: sigma 54-interacting transcriptional regulator [Desulfamplus sp.]|nr:sigma 54-interacting transcriptional regulator [Desulfamplus sp.]
MIEATQPPPFNFQCPKCNHSFSFEDFTKSIVQHGLILLTGKSTWFGCTCLFCDGYSTIIQQFPKDSLPMELQDIYDCIRHDKEWMYDYKLPQEKNYFAKYHLNEEDFPPNPTNMITTCLTDNWEYNSFPYTFSHSECHYSSCGDRLKSNAKSLTNLTEITRIFCHEHPVEVQKSIIEESDNSFCSYLEGSHVSGYELRIIWVTEQNIDKLMKFESDEKKKTLPRYTLYDATVEEIQTLCWNYKLQQEEMTKIEHETKMHVVEYLSISSKQQVIKNSDFLRILDQPYGHSDIETFTINYFPHNIPIMEHLGETSVYFNKTNRERITRKIWDNFHRGYIQDMLFTRADKFITEFINLSQHISYSYKAVLNLKEQYLRELHSAIISESERIKEKNKDIEYWQKIGDEAEKSFSEVKILSQDPKINLIKDLISRFAKVASTFHGPILLLGEKGTGKTHFAKAIHHALKRTGKFIKVDCGAKSENLFESEIFGHKKGAFTGATEDRKGAFELAEHGTIFLDEIGNIPKNLQQKLLGVIQDREYQPVGSSKTKQADTFIIVATNADLEAMIEQDKFKADLFDRIDLKRIVIPPLKERKMDIPLFFSSFKETLNLDPELENELMDFEYDWPGNIRELIHTIQSIKLHKIMYDDDSPISFKDVVDDLKRSGKRIGSYKKHLPVLPGNTKVTAEAVSEALMRHNGNKTKAGKELGVCYQTINRHSKKIER